MVLSACNSSMTVSAQNTGRSDLFVFHHNHETASFDGRRHEFFMSGGHIPLGYPPRICGTGHSSGASVQDFLRTLEIQRIDDHRYYHHSRINQTLHLISAMSFVFAYMLLFVDPIAASLVAWLVSMTSRQMGHFFFEPKTYDEVNRATHDYKEAIKVGYNLRRKVVLMAIWALSPALLLIDPTLFGSFEPAATFEQFMRHVGAMWLVVGVGGLLFRTVHLFFLQGVMAGLSWMTKILTDPFHDIKLYYKAPFYLMRGQLIDPMIGHRQA
jgi:hypothetical protein